MTRIYCKKGSKQVWKDIKVCRENCKRKCQNFKEKEEKLDTFEVIKSREMEPEERQKELTLDGNGGNQGEKLREEMEAINPLTGKKVMFCNRTTGQAHIH
jgi:hypothetical protein